MEVEHFSSSTIANYSRSTKELCQFSNQLPDQLSEDDLYRFLLYLKNERKLSRSTIRIYLQGLRFMYKSIYKRVDLIKDIPYPKRTKHLPFVPTGKEVLALINGAQSLKHRVLIEVIYSAGLRRGELIRLRVEHIDFTNKRIFIKDSKGNKDRYTLLAKSLEPELKRYIKNYQPQGYLFSGRYQNQPYSDESIKHVFNSALKYSGLTQRITPHSLRHAFASHLLSVGTDILAIQKLLGHEDLRTTMQYLRLNPNTPSHMVVSPLDYLFR